ncbi:hypothetical protein [Parasediminibacterium sp. JCM 36343]|uniref:hypothetical protein n=1 Tax=Parasediminibacterium sp. JCM 36343 TaxID=3374279 RepID=UPI0039796203
MPLIVICFFWLITAAFAVLFFLKLYFFVGIYSRKSRLVHFIWHDKYTLYNTRDDEKRKQKEMCNNLTVIMLFTFMIGTPLVLFLFLFLVK